MEAFGVIQPVILIRKPFKTVVFLGDVLEIQGLVLYGWL